MAITQGIRDRFAKSYGFPLKQATALIDGGFFSGKKHDCSLNILWRGDPLKDKQSDSIESIDRKNMEMLDRIAE